jgi:catechol 2,3-dioxygenase-like lactoylglutathione lyase family enzyme
VSAADLTLTIVAVADVVRSARFYREAFGWRARVEVPVYVEFELPGGRGFGVYQREGFGRNTGRVPFAIPAGEIAPHELYFRVDDPAAACERLTRSGARLLDPLKARDWGDEAAYFADPDGHVLVVSRPLVR